MKHQYCRTQQQTVINCLNKQIICFLIQQVTYNLSSINIDCYTPIKQSHIFIDTSEYVEKNIILSRYIRQNSSSTTTLRQSVRDRK